MAGAVVLLALGLSFIGTEPVGACSCAYAGVRARFEGAVAALIGEVVGPVGDDGDLDTRYRIRVERSVKGDLPGETEAVGPSSNSSCGPAPKGRVGLFLHDRNGGYGFGGCGSVVTPEQLLAAAEPLPPLAKGDPPLAYVMTESREARVLGVDRRGRVVSRVAGVPDPYGQLAACPGGSRIAVATREEPRLTIHDATTLAVVAERSLPPSGPFPVAFQCLSEDGSEILVASLGPGGRDGLGAVIVHRPGGSTVLWEGETSAMAVSPDGGVAVIAVATDRGFDVRRVDLTSSSAKSIGLVARRPERMLTIGSVVVIATGSGNAGGAELTVLASGRRPATQPVASSAGALFQIGDARIGVPLENRELQVFDDRLRHVGTWPDAASTGGSFAVGDHVVSAGEGLVRVADLRQPGGAAVLADLQYVTYAASVYPAPGRATSEAIAPVEPVVTTTFPPPTTAVAVPLAPIPVAVPSEGRAVWPGLAVAAAAVLAAVAIATGVLTRRRGARR